MRHLFTTIPFFLMLIFVGTDANAQCSTTPCTVPAVSFDAPGACILPSPDYLNCYFGQIVPSMPVSFPPFWCTSIENNQWFVFTATTPNVSFSIEAVDCASGGAIQAALLETTDCNNFSFASDCLGNIPSGSTQILVNNVPLVPGQNYYLMLDGSAGAVCSYTINGTSAITSGPSGVCIPDPVGPSVYTTNGPSQWTIIPPSLGTIIGPNPGNTATVNWILPGIAQICAQSTTCLNTPLYCMTVIIDETIGSTQIAYLCAGGTVECAGTIFNAPGTYAVQSGSTGCAITTCIIIPIPPVIANLGQVQLGCNGTFEACGQFFTNTGSQQVLCQNWQGCDSIVNFDIVAGDVLADAGPDMEIDCISQQAILDGLASSQGSNFSYAWTTADGNLVGGINTQTPTADTPGTYCLTVTDTTSGCIMTDCVIVLNGQTTFSYEDAICEGESYFFYGNLFTLPGVYTANVISATGCDSTVTLLLQVHPVYETIIAEEVIQGTIINGIPIFSDTTFIAYLTATNGCDSTVFINVTVLPNATQTLVEQLGFEIFPNPANNDFYIRFNLKQQGPASLKVFDVTGQMIKTAWADTRLEAGEHQLKMDVEDWSKGLYIVHFQTDVGRDVAKIVVD